MSIVFVCGGDRTAEPDTAGGHWAISSANGGSVSKDSTHAHTGTNSLKIVNDATVRNNPPGGTRQLVMRLWIWVPSTPSVLMRLVEVQGATQRLLSWSTSGKLQWFDGTNSTVALPLNQWNSVDLSLDTSANPHVGAWKINGVTQTPGSSAQAASDLTFYLLGAGNSAAGNRWYDDIAVSYTGADYPIPDGVVIWNGSAEVWALAVPSTAALSLATFAPTVTATAHQTATPSVASLALSAFAPAVTASDHKIVTPTTATVSLAAFTPAVTASDHQAVTPGVRALTLTGMAPSVTIAHPLSPSFSAGVAMAPVMTASVVVDSEDEVSVTWAT